MTLARRYTFCATLFLVAASTALASPRRFMAEGQRRFEQGDYTGAREAFEQAAAAARERGDFERMDPAAALYNMGKALFEQGAFEEAAAAFNSALSTADLALMQKIYFNRGNALVGESVQAESVMDLQGAIDLMQEAASMYEQSMALAPGDLDPKINYELALQRIEELEQNLQEQQQQEQQDGDGEEGDGDDQSDQPDDSDEGDQDGDPQQRPDQRPDAPDEGDGEPDGQPDDGESDMEPPSPRDAPRPARESEPMTPEEAEMLLNAIRDEELAARQRHRIQIGQPEEVEKDW